MKTRLLDLVSGSVLAVAACGKHDDRRTPRTPTSTWPMDNGSDEHARRSGVADDRAGLRQCRGGQRQFRDRKLEARGEPASSAAVKSFADKMISAHTASTAKLKSTAAG